MEQSHPEPIAVSPEEAARLIGIGLNTMYRALRRGDIPSVKVGSRIIVSVRALQAFLGPQPAETP